MMKAWAQNHIKNNGIESGLVSTIAQMIVGDDSHRYTNLKRAGYTVEHTRSVSRSMVGV